MRVVHMGVDTLEGSFRGVLYPGVAACLDELKAQSAELGSPARFPGLKYEMVVSPSGVKPWRWLLAGEDMHLRLTEAANLPTVSVKLLAIGLAAYGWENLYGMAESFVQEFGHLEESGLSRIDICADLQGVAVDEEVMRGVVCPATYRGLHFAGTAAQTFHYGKEEIVVRVYNKTAELSSSDKGWMREVWAHSPDYEPAEDVWRVEAQLRRPFLNEVGYVAAADVFEHLGDLWRTALGWCELRVPCGENTTRWPVHPAWSMLAELIPESRRLERVKAAGYLESFEQAVPQMMGLLVSGCAALGVRELDMAFGILRSSGEVYLDQKGGGFDAAVEAKMRARLLAGKR